MKSLNSQIKISNSSPRIYVACLAAYNNGFLHGSWIEVNLGLEHVEESIIQKLAYHDCAKFWIDNRENNDDLIIENFCKYILSQKK